MKIKVLTYLPPSPSLVEGLFGLIFKKIILK